MSMQVKQHTKENVNCEDCGSVYCQICYIICPNCSSVHITNPLSPIKWELGDAEFSQPTKKIFHKQNQNDYNKERKWYNC